MNTSYSRDQFLSLFERRRAEVTVTADRITIEIGALSPYEIPFAELHCDRDILERVMHLFEHTSVDVATIRTFVHHARGYLRKTQEPVPEALSAHALPHQELHATCA